MKYGLPYKGSKNAIARDIVTLLPKAQNFYDLFAGGCAVTHAAMLSGKWNNFFINDIDGGIVQLFQDAVNGKYHNESAWISGEAFELLRESDPFIKYCWSFGNNGKDYLYSPEIERFKQHLHAMFFSQTPHEARLHWRKFVNEFRLVRKELNELTEKVEALCAECNVALIRNPDGTINTERVRKDVLKVLNFDIRQYMRKALKESGRTASDVDKLLGTNGMAGHYFSASQWELPTAEAYQKMQSIIPGLTVPWAELKESLESLERLERLQSLESLERLQSYSKDYQEIEIKPNSVLYCDIPYRGTDGYGKKQNEFDYDRFYKWACEQSEPVFVSEYWMPEETFECIWEKKKTSSYGSGNGKKTIEKIFIPRKGH